jgi:AraC-like DNA-binding protein
MGKAKKCRALGQPVDVSSKRPKNCGRKKVHIDLSIIATIPLHKRSTIRKLANELGVSKTSLHRLFKQGVLRCHSNSLKHFLKEANKKERLRWCLSMLDPTTMATKPKFIDMENIIHIDEKWFNATKKNNNFYMLPEEVNPHRTVQNKNSIDKVMVLSAIALPKYDDEGNETFSGKIGLWPFVRREPAKRSSRNRARGTLVTKSINMV